MDNNNDEIVEQSFFDTDTTPVVRRLGIKTKRYKRILGEDLGTIDLKDMLNSDDPVHIALLDAVIRRCHQLYDDCLGDLVFSSEDLGVSTWGNFHILKFCNTRNLRGLASLTMGEPCYNSLTLIGFGIERLVELSESPNLSAVMDQIRTEHEGYRASQWLFNLTVLSPLLSHCFVNEASNIHCYALASCLVQFSCCADQFILNQDGWEVPQELIEFVETSVRVTSPKLAQFSGLTHVFGKEVQQYLDDE